MGSSSELAFFAERALVAARSMRSLGSGSCRPARPVSAEVSNVPPVEKCAARRYRMTRRRPLPCHRAGQRATTPNRTRCRGRPLSCHNSGQRTVPVRKRSRRQLLNALRLHHRRPQLGRRDLAGRCRQPTELVIGGDEGRTPGGNARAHHQTSKLTIIAKGSSSLWLH
jgi:hypothetical protein